MKCSEKAFLLKQHVSPHVVFIIVLVRPGVIAGSVGPVIGSAGPCVKLHHVDRGADVSFVVEEPISLAGVVISVFGAAPEEAFEEFLHSILLLLQESFQPVPLVVGLLPGAERAVPEHLAFVVHRRLLVLGRRRQGLGRLALVLAQVRCVLVLRQAGELSEAVRSADS